MRKTAGPAIAIPERMARLLSTIPPAPRIVSAHSPPPLPVSSSLAQAILSVAPEPFDSTERYSLIPNVSVKRSINPSIPPKEVAGNVSILPAARDYFVSPDSTQDMVPVVDFDDSVRGVFVATHEVVPVGSKISIWVDDGVEVTGTVAFRRDPQGDMWPGLGVLLSEEDAQRVCSFVNHRHTFFYPMESMPPPAAAAV